MGTADKKLSSFYWDDQHRPAQIHQYTRRTGGIAGRQLTAMWRIPSKQLELKLKQIQMAKIPVQARRSGVFTQNSFGNDIWMFLVQLQHDNLCNVDLFAFFQISVYSFPGWGTRKREVLQIGSLHFSVTFIICSSSFPPPSSTLRSDTASNFTSWLQVYEWNHTAFISSTAELDRSQGTNTSLTTRGLWVNLLSMM